MRKIISMLFACLCIISLTACSSSKVEEDAMKDYLSMMKKSQSITSAHMDGKLLFTLEKENINAKVSFAGDFFAQTKPQLAFELSAAANGIRMDNLAKAYMKDNVLYVNVLEQEKIAFPFDEKLIGKTKNTTKQMDSAAIKKAFKELTVTKENDKKVIKGIFSDMVLSEMKKQVKSTYNEDVNVKNISSVEVAFTANKENYLENVNMKMNVTYHMDTLSKKDEDNTTNGQDLVMNIDMTFNLSNHNHVKSITFPDFKEYKKTTDIGKSSKDLFDQIEGNSL